MEFTPRAKALRSKADQISLAEGLQAFVQEGGRPHEALMFDGLVYEQDPLTGDYYMALYTGELQGVNTDTDEPSLSLLATEKHLCIRNGADGVERTVEENFERFLDPPEDKDDGEWQKLDWTPRVINIPLSHLDTNVVMALPCDEQGHIISHNNYNES